MNPSIFLKVTGDAIDGVKEAAGNGAEAAAGELGFFARYLTADRLLAYMLTGIRLIILCLLLFILWRIGRFFLDRVMGRQKRRAGVESRAQISTLNDLLQSIWGYLMIFLGIMGALSVFGFDMRGLAASAGVAGLLIAFISQSIIKDWISGIFIIIEHQHHVGDWVRILGHEGEVVSMGMRTTVIRTWENETVYIPNGSIAEIVNLSKAPQRGILDLHIASDEPSTHVLSTLDNLVKVFNEEHAVLLDEPLELLGIENIERDAVVWRLTFTALERSHFRLQRELRMAAKEALEKADIEQPYPLITLRDAARKGEEDAH